MNISEVFRVIKRKEKIRKKLKKSSWWTKDRKILKGDEVMETRRVLNLVFAGLALTIIVLFLVYLTGPALHWLWFDIFYLNPVFVALIAVLVILVILGSGSMYENESTGSLYWAGAVIAVILLAGYMLVAGTLADQLFVKGLHPTQISTLPATKGVRYVPYEVAVAYSKNRFTNPLYQAGDIDPIDQGNELDWVAPRIPNGIWNQIWNKTNGVVVIKPDGSLHLYLQTFEVGEDMYITSNIRWALWNVNYWVEIPEVYYLFDHEQILAMAPYVSYDFKFPVMVPKWGGVFVVHGDGTIEDLTPAEAIADPRFTGQRLYPEALEHRKGESWQFMDGILNAWFVHTNQVEMPTVSDSRNQMPYLVPGEPNPYWFIGFEPHGNSFSTYKVLLTDAHTGADMIYEVPKDKNLLGPNSVLGYIRSAQPNVQWVSSSGGGNGTIVVIEPKPIIRPDGRLYWQASMTNTSHASVIDNPVVDAETGQVYLCRSLAELQDFVAGKTNCVEASNPAVAATNQPTTTGAAPSSAVSTVDLTKLSDQDLRALMQRILDEMNRRAK